MNTTQGSLVIVGANTDQPEAYWNGKIIEGITGITVTNTELTQRVVLRLPEPLQELVDAGIIIKRGV